MSHIHARADEDASETVIFSRLPLTHELGRVPTIEAPVLAAELMLAAHGGKLGYTLTCPKCREGLITIIYFPGDPGVHTFGNGDPGYPPEAPYIESLEATCDCWPDEELDKVLEQGHVVERALMAVVGAIEGIADFYMDQAMSPFFDEPITDEEIDRQLAQRHGDGVQSPKID